MQYMGDYPLAEGQQDVNCVYSLLAVCHRHGLALVDEVFCQIIKQLTNNRSSKPYVDSQVQISSTELLPVKSYNSLLWLL